MTEAAHPLPDAAGAQASVRMLDLLAGLGEGDVVLALISGGASALLCAPVPGVTLAEKQAANAALLASGAPIGQMNTVRKHLSRVKAGNRPLPPPRNRWTPPPIWHARQAAPSKPWAMPWKARRGPWPPPMPAWRCPGKPRAGRTIRPW